jgi:hypothetical protein
MSTGSKLKITMAVLLSSALLGEGMPALASPLAAQDQLPSRKSHNSRKKQAEPPPPLPSGPTGRPVPPMPLDAMSAVPPQVIYENSQLTINAPNSTLADILRAVRKQTGAEIEVPSAPERVVTHLGPGPAREVLAELLNGSRFNYVLLGSPSDETALTRVVLVAKGGIQEMPSPVAPGTPLPQTQAGVDQPESEAATEANEAEATDENNNADENNDQQPAEAEQTQPAEPNGIKTPQQMLQEMQQRQMQMQQQQQQGQPPIQGSGMPPHPPQQN